MDTNTVLLIFGIACIFCFLFKVQIKEFIWKLDKIKVSFGGFILQLDAEKFREGVKQAKVHAQGVEDNMAASGVKPEVHKDINLSSQSERDAVLLSWGAVKQAVFDACIARKMPLTPATGVQDAVQRLADSGAINSDLQNLLNVLNDLGKELAAETSVKPLKADARVYIELAYTAVDWIMLNIVSPETKVVKSDKIESHRQVTVVGENFPSPSKSDPAAMLVGISGPLQDKRFPVDKDGFNIGRNNDNDLPITGDNFVSGKHASIKYDNGALFLLDQGSRNGTFLNGKRLNSSAVSIRHGDTIRLGNSILQVTEA